MKRMFAWLAGAVGAGAAYRALRRKPAAAAVDPADELRAKLAEAKAGSDPVEPASDPDVDERRQAVHDEARAAIDELQGGDS